MSDPTAPMQDDSPTPRDAGLSLVEVIVAIGLFGLVATILLGFAISTSRVTEDTRGMANVGEESRLAMERMTRELRQARQIQHVDLGSATEPLSFTFWTDFDNDNQLATAGVDPELLTYRWYPAGSADAANRGKLTLTANDIDGNSITRPVLAAKVTAFSVDFNSSSWEYAPTPSATPDPNEDSVTTWQDLDRKAAPIGNNNGLLDGNELKLIDLMNIRMTVTDGTHQLNYRTQVDLRNQNQN